MTDLMPRYAPLSTGGFEKKTHQQNEDILRSKCWTNRQWIETLSSPLTCLIKCKNQMIVWVELKLKYHMQVNFFEGETSIFFLYLEVLTIFISQSYDPQWRKKKCVMIYNKQKQTAALTCFCCVHGRRWTHKQSSVQTNRRLCDDITECLPTLHTRHDRNSARYSHGLSSVCGHCGYEWRPVNKGLTANVHSVKMNPVLLQ